MQNNMFGSRNSMLQHRLNSVTEKKQEVIQNVTTQYISATNEEQAYIDQIVKNVGEKFATELANFGETEEVKRQINDYIREQAELLPPTVNFETRQRIIKLAIDTTGLGPLEPLLKDPEITEIVVQRYDKIMIEKKGKIQDVDAGFNSEDHLVIVINKIVQSKGKTLNLMTPIVDTRLDDGSRVNATIPPVTPDGATLCIRKFSQHKLGPEEYLKFGSVDEKMLKFLEMAVIGKANIIISGGTGTGKTTFLNMLSNYIPKGELIVTIEDTCELQLQSPRVRRMETRTSVATSDMMQVDIAMEVKNALRMRPDRIIVGEIRDGAIVDMLSALSTGHDGGLATVHANSPHNLLTTRMPILYGQNKDMKMTEYAQKVQFSESIELVVQLRRFRDGKRRVVEITAINGLDDEDNVVLNPIFVYNEFKQRFEATGFIPEKILDKAMLNGVEIDKSIFTPPED